MLGARQGRQPTRADGMKPRPRIEQAIAASPDSAFLYRDLAAVEQKAGDPPTRSSTIARPSISMPTDARSLAAIGAILEANDDVVGALSAYERARAIDPAEVPEDVMTRLRARAALAKLPAEYRAIPGSAGVDRAERSPR